MSRATRVRALGAAVIASLGCAGGLVRAEGDVSELDRARGALERARTDLALEGARGEAGRAEAARVVSAAVARREAAAQGLARARKVQRELDSRAQAVRSGIDGTATASQAAGTELALIRDVLHEAAGMAPDLGGPAPGQEKAHGVDPTDEAGQHAGAAPGKAALAARLDDPDSDLGGVCRDEVAALTASALLAGAPTLGTEDVEILGRGRSHGRVLRAGPCAWFASREGIEAVAVASRGSAGPGPFVPCDGSGIARALDAFERGERTLSLPVILRAPANKVRGSGIERAARLLSQGGLAMAPLALLSFIGLFVFVERLLSRRRTLARARSLVGRVTASLASGDPAGAAAVAQESASLGGALRLWVEGDRTEATGSLRSSLLAELREGLWLLGTVGSSAPFVGLFGTVIGIIRAFEDIGERGSSGFAVVASGISEALVATAAGIVVAVLAMIAYNALQAGATRGAGSVARALERAQGPSPRGSP